MLSGLIAIIALVLVLDARSRMKRLEYRLSLFERAPFDAARPAKAPVSREEETFKPEEVADLIPEPEPVVSQRAFVPEPARLEIAALSSVTQREELAPADAEQKPRGFSFSFEDLFGRRLPIWAGGITLAIAGVLIVKYAIDAGLLTPWVRVLGGFLFGSALIAGAEAAMRNEDVVRDARVRQALSGAGLATFYATILMASNTYGLIGPIAAFVLMAGVTAGALGLSIRFGAPSALLGLAGGLATPALVGSLQPDIPLLSVYLGLTIAGLAAVSRMQRWAWLGLSALVGGAGWSLWMIAASSALDTMASMSIGGLVLLLAIALPVMAFDGPRVTFLRAAAALVGAIQLAMLVALGGFSALHWGLFGLIALAGQWLSWREKGFEIVPSISLALSAMLLAVYPDPPLGLFSAVGVAMALIHGVPLMLRLWVEPARERVALEFSGLALAILIVPMIHFYRFDHSRDVAFTLLALAGALVPAVGLAIGWKNAVRKTDRRFAWLTTASALLLLAACAFSTLVWALPLGAAAIAATLLFFGQRAADDRIELIAAGFGLSSLAFLVVTTGLSFTEWSRLAGAGGAILDPHTLFRWAGLAAAAALFAVSAKRTGARWAGQLLATLLAYGAIAQVVHDNWLALVPAFAVAALTLWSRRLAWPQLAPATGVAAGLVLLWAAAPVLVWTGHGLLSFAGEPMPARIEYLGLTAIVRQLLIPAILAALALWGLRERLTRGLALAGLASVAVLGVVSLHSLYRIGVAEMIGTNFVSTGLAERLIWAAFLIATGSFVWGLVQDRRSARYASVGLIAAGALHTLYYTILLHNPLWAEQTVGPWPLVNLLLPAFALAPLGLWQLARILPHIAKRYARSLDLLHMTLVALFAYATLRQAFHGTLLTAPGLGDVENILASILAIVLAIGFLLWGIRAQKRDWRIASLVLMLGAVGKVFLFDASGLEGLLRIGSFVALGFSLIGIGWLYARQLGSTATKEAT